jgi:nucleoside diphosphate kinase
MKHPNKTGHDVGGFYISYRIKQFAKEFIKMLRTNPQHIVVVSGEQVVFAFDELMHLIAIERDTGLVAHKLIKTCNEFDASK